MLNPRSQTQFFNLFKNSKHKLKVLVILCVIYLGFISECFAVSLNNAKAYFLKGDYQNCIDECEKILASAEYSRDLDELYYFLGLSYLKQGNLLRASDIFDIITNEFPRSKFNEDAIFSSGDIYFLKYDYDNAEKQYKQIMKTNPNTKLKSRILFRLAQTSLKKGKWQEARQYSGSLEKDFPLSFEKALIKNLSSQEFYFTVQVGAFANISNAQKLCKELTDKGYSAYLQEPELSSIKIYRVRVGKLDSRPEAEQLENKLIFEGYPTKIFP